MESEDRQWLREFADGNSEAAFRALVDRHVGLVHAAARRQVGDEHLAEEVSQAVDYWESPAGRAWALRGDNRSFRVHETDGTFATEDEFRPGEYELSVGVAGGVRKLRVTVPASAEGRSQVDLGDLVLE